MNTGPGQPCDWCEKPIPAGARSDAEVCDVVCRKRRWRFRNAVNGHGRRPTRPAHQVGDRAVFAYADPPYPGKAGYYAEDEEVDHDALTAMLQASYRDGWALSTSAAALRDVLPLCPPGARVAVWRRRVRMSRTRRPVSAWEPLIVVGGRALPDGRDTLDVIETSDVNVDDLELLDYRGRYHSFPGALIGMKPPEFCAWLFRNLGARAGDELVDVYPGSGAVGRAWALYTGHATGTPTVATP